MTMVGRLKKTAKGIIQHEAISQNVSHFKCKPGSFLPAQKKPLKMRGLKSDPIRIQT
jgi:hypothetical protein